MNENYLSFTVEISVTHATIFHLVLEHTVHVRELELGNKKTICSQKKGKAQLNFLTEIDFFR